MAVRVVRGSKPDPLRRLAYTPDDENAFLTDVSGCVGAGEIVSSNGSHWKPDFLSNGRLTMFIAGVPGAGKSYLAKEMINSLPDNYDILLFTALSEDDGNFSDLAKGKKLWKIRMEPENLKKMTLANIRAASKHPVLLFDDVDKIRDRTVSNLMFSILDDALANGRGHKKHNGEGDIHVIVTSHALNDWKKTKYSLENSDYVAVFPGSTTYGQLERLFSKIGLDKDLCKEMSILGRQGKFRSVIVHKVSPMYIIFGDTIRFL